MSDVLVLATYTLQLIDERPILDYEGLTLVGASATASFLNHLRETEENLNDLLPDGYSVRIREWDEEEK